MNVVNGTWFPEVGIEIELAFAFVEKTMTDMKTILVSEHGPVIGRSVDLECSKDSVDESSHITYFGIIFAVYEVLL